MTISPSGQRPGSPVRRLAHNWQMLVSREQRRFDNQLAGASQVRLKRDVLETPARNLVVCRPELKGLVKMRFAAIADVHGNRLALDAVLADIAAIGISEVVN